MAQEKGSKEMTRGGVILEAGNAKKYETGSWRTFKPQVDKTKCNNCLFCWMYCPESCIKVKDDKVENVDLRYCKGCGICAKECPKKAIQMIKEEK